MQQLKQLLQQIRRQPASAARVSVPAEQHPNFWMY
jgi:hypothetical protein